MGRISGIINSIALIAIVANWNVGHAQISTRAVEFSQKAASVATRFANSVSCPDVKAKLQHVIALVPYNGIIEDRPEAKLQFCGTVISHVMGGVDLIEQEYRLLLLVEVITSSLIPSSHRRL